MERLDCLIRAFYNIKMGFCRNLGWFCLYVVCFCHYVGCFCHFEMYFSHYLVCFLAHLSRRGYKFVQMKGPALFKGTVKIH